MADLAERVARAIAYENLRVEDAAKVVIDIMWEEAALAAERQADHFLTDEWPVGGRNISSRAAQIVADYLRAMKGKDDDK